MSRSNMEATDSGFTFSIIVALASLVRMSFFRTLGDVMRQLLKLSVRPEAIKPSKPDHYVASVPLTT